MINRIEVLDILLVHTRYVKGVNSALLSGFIPKSIRRLTNSNYNHAAIVVDVLGEKMVLEAVERGVIITKSLEDWVQESKDLGCRDFLVLRPKKTFNFNPEKVKESLLNDVGKYYDYKGTFWDQLRYRVFKKWMDRKAVDDGNQIFCSELIERAYKMYPDKSHQMIAPSDIEALIGSKLEIVESVKTIP